MYEELYNLLDPDDSGANNTGDGDSFVLDIQELEIEDIDDLDDAPKLADMSAAAEVVTYDYSYLETTNQYLYVIILLLVFFVVTYIFNFLRHSFERLGF